MKLAKKIGAIFSVFGVFLLFAPSVFAAAPDGLGPWADSVFSVNQGLMKNGLAVPAIRSDPTSALGVAEGTNVEGTFIALGFGGNIVLGFDNGIRDGVLVVEATIPSTPQYPDEKAKVEMSADGVHWVTAGNIVFTGSVTEPETIPCAKYVRITDISDPSIFSDATADAYDVDGVKATGDPCTVTSPTPTLILTPTATPTATLTPTSVPTITPTSVPGPTPTSTPSSNSNSNANSNGSSGPTPTPSPSNNTVIVAVAPCPRTGNPLIPCFPNTGNIIPGLPNTGIDPDSGNVFENIQNSIQFILSVIFKFLHFKQ